MDITGSVILRVWVHKKFIASSGSIPFRSGTSNKKLSVGLSLGIT